MRARIAAGVVALATSLTTALATPALGEDPPVLRAGDCGPAPSYPTVQAAVDAAPPRSTVVVCPGHYDEAVLVAGKPGLTLRAQTSRTATIEAPPGGSVRPVAVTVTSSPGARVQGLVLRSIDTALVGASPGLTVQGVDAVAQDDAIQVGADRARLRDVRASSGQGYAVDVVGDADDPRRGIRVVGGRLSGGDGAVRLVDTVGAVVRGVVVPSGEDGIVVEASAAPQITDTVVRGLVGGTGIRLTDVVGGEVARSSVRSTGFTVGIVVTGASEDIRVVSSVFLDNDLDAADATTGSGTAGTANLWSGDRCRRASPAGLCG